MHGHGNWTRSLLSYACQKDTGGDLPSFKTMNEFNAFDRRFLWYGYEYHKGKNDRFYSTSARWENGQIRWQDGSELSIHSKMWSQNPKEPDWSKIGHDCVAISREGNERKVYTDGPAKTLHASLVTVKCDENNYAFWPMCEVK